MGLLDSVLGGVLGQLGNARGEEGSAGGLNPKLMMALGLLAMLAMRNRSQESGSAAPVDDGLGGLGSLGGLLGGMIGGNASAPGATGGLDLGSLLGGLLGGQGGAPANSQALGALMHRVAALTDERRAAMARAGQRIIADWGPERFADGLMRAAETALRAPLPALSWFDQALLWAVARRPL